MSTNRKINKERQIGFKKLTPSDLGRTSGNAVSVLTAKAVLRHILGWLNYEYCINTSRDIYNVVCIKVSQGR